MPARHCRRRVDAGELHVAWSVGVAMFPAAGADWEALFRSTDVQTLQAQSRYSVELEAPGGCCVAGASPMRT
ncbi:MAG: hypothetical protein JW940_06140, partial [Polyangiaceae bacterium]|nr:hypothetical protein [Polyangiaceae bacterium]